MKPATADVLVKVIAVLGYIGAGYLALTAVWLVIAAFLPAIPSGMFTLVMIIVAVVLLALAVLYALMARALWLHRNWARILQAVFSGMGILGSLLMLVLVIFAMFTVPEQAMFLIFYLLLCIISIALSVSIFILLVFNKAVKKLFA